MADNGFLLKLDGKVISDFKVVLGGFDIEWKQEYSSLGEYESVTSQSPLSPFKRNHGGKYTNSLKRELSFASSTTDGLTQQEYAEFQETYYNKSDFLKMEFPDHPILKNYYYMVKLLNPQEVIANGKIYESKCEVECDSPYAYCLNDFEETYTETGEYTLNCTSHQDGIISPSLTITGNGTISVINTTNNTGFVVNVASGETVTIDSMHDVQSSDTSIKYKLLDCDLSTYKTLSLEKGVNKISILSTGTLGYVKIKFPICKKVGW